MMKRLYRFFFFVIIISFSYNVYALEGDLMQSVDVSDNGNGTVTITGMIGAHKMDNSDNTFYICSDINHCEELIRNDTERRTDMNLEESAGDVYNYDNLGINQTVPSNYNLIVIKDKNGNVVAQGDLIDKHSTNAGIKIMGTQCDLRNATGNRSGMGLDKDLSGFKTGEVYNIVSVHDNVMTDKGDIATMYCVGISDKAENINGYNVYAPGNSATRCVFDSCGTLSKDGNNITKPSDSEDGKECKDTYGTLKSCNGNMSSEIDTCGGLTEGICTGSYETASVYKPSTTLNIDGDSCKLIDEEENICKFASCGYTQTAILSLSVDLDMSKTYLAGTYFSNPSLISVVSVSNTITGGVCPSWNYLCDASGNFKSESACTSINYNNSECSCKKHYDSEYGYRDENNKPCTPAGSSWTWNSNLSGGSNVSSSCKYVKLDDSEWDGTYDCDYQIVKQGTPKCDAIDRCNSEMSAQGLFSYTSVGKISGTGTVKFATDSNSSSNSNKYEFQFSGGNISNKAFVKKTNGYVLYDLANVNLDEYLVYDNVHFIPIDYKDDTYYVDIVSDLTINTGSSTFSVNLNTNKQCVVKVENKFFPTKPTTPPDDCVGEDCDDGGYVCDTEPCGYGFIYRSIDLNVPFPNSEIVGCVGSNCRDIGENWYTWINDADNQKRLASTYNNSPEYVVYLDNAMISSIRAYNKSLLDNNGDGYLNESINVDGSSDFFKKNVASICASSNASTLCDVRTDYYGLGIGKKWGK